MVGDQYITPARAQGTFDCLLILLLILIPIFTVFILVTVTIARIAIIVTPAIPCRKADVFNAVEDNTEDRCLRTIHLRDRVTGLLAGGGQKEGANAKYKDL